MYFYCFLIKHLSMYIFIGNLFPIKHLINYNTCGICMCQLYAKAKSKKLVISFKINYQQKQKKKLYLIIVNKTK